MSSDFGTMNLLTSGPHVLLQKSHNLTWTCFFTVCKIFNAYTYIYSLSYNMYVYWLTIENKALLSVSNINLQILDIYYIVDEDLRVERFRFMLLMLNKTLFS